MRALASDPKVDALDRLGIKVIVIGLGSPALITPYRRTFSALFSHIIKQR